MFTKTLIAVSLAASALISTSAFAHEKVDLLIKNATVLTMDKDRTVFEQGLVAVKGNQIIAVTDGKDVENYQAKTTIDAEGDIVMPGLINTHTHVSMTVFRSLADDGYRSNKRPIASRPRPVDGGSKMNWPSDSINRSSTLYSPTPITITSMAVSYSKRMAQLSSPRKTPRRKYSRTSGCSNG
jgi:hypothetical protein